MVTMRDVAHRAGVSAKTGNPVYERPVVLVLYRADHKFLLNAGHGGWSRTQSDAALKLLAMLYNGRTDLSSLRG